MVGVCLLLGVVCWDDVVDGVCVCLGGVLIDYYWLGELCGYLMLCKGCFMVGMV